MSIFKRGTVEPKAPMPKPETKSDPRLERADDPWWVKKAFREKGQAEIAGSRDNPRIVYYHSFTSLRATDDETPWCASFMNFIFSPNGTRSAMARSWLKWAHGRELAKTNIPRGAVVIHSSNRGPESGHVTIYLGDAGDGYMWVLGGNQQNMVGVHKWPYSTLLGVRWPDSVAEKAA
jgi:uncharacterized protein (TIGR02594 family)